MTGSLSPDKSPVAGYYQAVTSMTCPGRPGQSLVHGVPHPPLQTNVVIAVGNCGMYVGPWGVRVEDTVVVTGEGPRVLTIYPRHLQALSGGLLSL